MMRPSTIFTILTVFSGAGMAVGIAFEQSTDVEGANGTQELSELIDSLVWLDDALPSYLGDKVPGDNFLSLCSGDHSGDVVSFDKVDLTPNPPVRGQNLTVDATGTIKTTVEAGAKVAIKVKLGPTTVYRKTFDLCKEIEKVGGRCPINSGKPRIVKTFTVPRGIPRGTYTAVVNVAKADGSPITCLEGKFKA